MNRIDRRLDELRQSGRKALAPYLTAGDPSPELTVDLMHELVSAGADVIELGFPFSDPMADGPVIQAACQRALERGVNLQAVLAMVADFRRQDTATPVVLMGYLNPIEAMGYERCFDAARAAGVDGLLMVDMTAEEMADLRPLLAARDLHPIFLVSPTTSERRLQRICGYAGGYLYYVSLKGVTGSDRIDVNSLAGKLDRIRRQTGLPILVGFGIREAATAAAVAAVADGVVVGSALVQRIAENLQQPASMRREVSDILTAMRAALDRVRTEQAV